jgi:hypothetical protein
VDPYLELGGDDLRVTSMDISQYASSTDNASALEFLDIVRSQDDISTESVVSLILSNLSTSFGVRFLCECSVQYLYVQISGLLYCKDGTSPIA